MRLHYEEKMPALSGLTLIHAMSGVTALGPVQTSARALTNGLCGGRECTLGLRPSSTAIDSG